MTCSFWFIFFSGLAAHHDNEVWHDGDIPYPSNDFGICQLEAVKDRIEIKGNLFLNLTNFGDHGLHHLFPTVD